MYEFLPIVTVACITGAGVVTGLLFAFSNFVMQALADLPVEHGMYAMQRINKKIINPVFLVFFLGTPVSCLAIAVIALAAPGNSATCLLVAGAMAYLIGPFGITILFNVPLNNRLASAEPTEAKEVWPIYQANWQRWNHIRTGIGIVSIIFLAFGLTDIRSL